METLMRIYRIRAIRFIYLMATGCCGLTAIGFAYARLEASLSLMVLHWAALAATMIGGMVVGWELHKDPETRVIFEKEDP